MSIWSSMFGGGCYGYEGSSAMPTRHADAFRLDVAAPAAHIPTRLESARGKTYIDAREGGAPGHPWLRFTAYAEGNSFVMHENDVRDLVEFLQWWLERPKLKRVG